MTGSLAAQLRDETPMYAREWPFETYPDAASVSYASPRSDRVLSRQGTGLSVTRDDEGRMVFAFHDDERDEDIRVVVGETTGESTVWSGEYPLGSPLKISVGRSFNEIVMRATERGYGMGPTETPADYEAAVDDAPVIVAAGIQRNEGVLAWMWPITHAATGGGDDGDELVGGA